MPELERTPEDGAESDGTDTTAPADTGTTLEVAGADVAVSGGPTDPEAAALSAALLEHIRVEGVEAEAGGGEPRYAVDPWCLAGRLGRRSRTGVPATCPRGREWKMAGRTTR